MNYYLLLIVLGLANISFGKNFTLQELKDKNIANVAILPNENSTHYHSPLSISIKNNSNETINLSISNGDVLEPNDDSYQRFIVTESLHLVVKPLQKENALIKGMCIDQHKSAPFENIKYTVSNYTPSNLEKKIVAFIDENKFFEPNAQFLLWDILTAPQKFVKVEAFNIIDNKITPMIRDDKNHLISFYPKIESYEEPMAIKEVSGSFNLTLALPKNLHIAMFDTNNILVKELYKNPNTPKGKTTLEYAFNSLEFNEDTYFIKVVMDGNILMNKKVDLAQSMY